jgi:hypothetical protein
MKRVLVRFIALAGIFTILIATAFAYYLPIQESYHPLNTGWNGCSEIFQMYGNTTLLSSYDGAFPSGSLLAIIGPNLDFTTHDASMIHTFLDAGGTVLLADNFGTGNLLLEALGVNVRISGKQLADLYFYTRNSVFPIAYDFSPSPLTANLTAIVFNRPSYLLAANSSVTILASSSPFSFIDLGQGRPVANESVASYPIIAKSAVGKGSLIVIADPNVFTNEMVGLFDNTLLFRNLMKGHNHLIIDVAHLRNAPLTSYRIQLKQEFDITRDFLFFSQTGAYLQWASLVAMILGFSLEIARRMRKVKWASPPKRNHA